jgi:hypothetical protein
VRRRDRHSTGPVEVVGVDHFDLDRDGDAFACEDS